jgi:hypothetical protein
MVISIGGSSSSSSSNNSNNSYIMSNSNRTCMDGNIRSATTTTTTNASDSNRTSKASGSPASTKASGTSSSSKTYCSSSKTNHSSSKTSGTSSPTTKPTGRSTRTKHHGRSKPLHLKCGNSSGPTRAHHSRGMTRHGGRLIDDDGKTAGGGGRLLCGMSGGHEVSDLRHLVAIAGRMFNLDLISVPSNRGIRNMSGGSKRSERGMHREQDQKLQNFVEG